MFVGDAVLDPPLEGGGRSAMVVISLGHGGLVEVSLVIICLQNLLKKFRCFSTISFAALRLYKNSIMFICFDSVRKTNMNTADLVHFV